jgi:hypothetical protein
MSDDKVFTNKVFNLILFSDLSGMNDAALKKYIGHNYAKYDKTRAQLAAHIIKVHHEGETDAEVEYALGDKHKKRVPDDLQFQDCDVHAGSYAILKVEAAGEKDWHQHSMWACYFASLSGSFEDARGTLREVYNELFDMQHKDGCDKMIPAYAEQDKSCTCDVGKLLDKMLAALKRLGGA